MFDPAKISAALTGLIGWRQPFNPDFAKINATNLASRSGYFITDNPLCKVEYLFDSQDFADISDANFNTHLIRKQQESITSVCNAVFNEADYIDRQVLYQFTQNIAETEVLPEGFIGYRIKVVPKKNIAFKITRVLLDFDSANTANITLQLFNTSRADAIFSQLLTIDADHKEVALNWIVDNSGDTYKGEYYLGYVIGAGVTVTPFKRQFESGNIESLVTHLNIRPIEVSGHTAATLFNIDDVDGFSQAVGVNPDITVYDDFTDLIKQNDHLFSRAIQLSLQISCLSEYIASLRSNRNERRSNEIAVRMLAEVEGQDGEGTIKIEGLRPQLSRSIATIKQQITKLRQGYFGSVLMVQTLN